MKKLLLGGISIFFALSAQAYTIHGTPGYTYYVTARNAVEIQGQIYRTPDNGGRMAYLGCTVTDQSTTTSYVKIRDINFVSAITGSPTYRPYPLPAGVPSGLHMNAITYDGAYINLHKPRGILFRAVQPPSVDHVSSFSVICKQILPPS